MRGFCFIQMIKMVVGYRLWVIGCGLLVVGVFVGLAYNRHPHSNQQPITDNLQPTTDNHQPFLTFSSSM